MSWPDSWAGSSASAPGLGTTSSSHRGRRRALLRPAVPAGSDLWEFGAGLRPPTRPHPVTPSARRGRSPRALPFCIGGPRPRPRVGCARRSATGRSPAPPGLPPHEVPGWGCPVASRPAARTRLPTWSPRLRHALRPVPGSADRLTVRGRPVARLRSLPLS